MTDTAALPEPHYVDDLVTVHHGDCLEVLKALPDASVDSVVTDPPYGLEFMGKDWDSFRQLAGVERSARWSGERSGGQGALDQRSTTTAAAGTVSIGSGKRPTTARCLTCGKRDAFRNEHPCDVDGTAEWVAEVVDPNSAPPSSLAFGAWCELWARECLRVLKPGGHLLAFGGTRTWHRLAVAVEDSGFEIRDNIAWMYGSGFPKSLNVGKALDKAAGAVRDTVRVPLAEVRNPKSIDGGHGVEGGDRPWMEQAREVGYHEKAGDVPVTDEAKAWDGWGTALKPSHEPVVVARKPLTGTVAANVLAHGTGALNIAGCRTAGREQDQRQSEYSGDSDVPVVGARDRSGEYPADLGRWPANVVLDGDMADALDEQSGELTSGANPTRRGSDKFRDAYGDFAGGTESPARGADSGGASRFFHVVDQDPLPIDSLEERFRYVPKPDSSERIRIDGTAHPTVKPLDLMRWLVRLVTPTGGTVLEPFAGSGTTVEAALLEGVHVIAIERDADYLPLIVQRVNRRRDPVAAVKGAGEDLGLFALLEGDG